MKVFNTCCLETRWQNMVLAECSQAGLNPAPSRIASTVIGWLDGKWAIEWMRRSDAKTFKIEQKRDDPESFVICGVAILRLSDPQGMSVFRDLLPDLLKELGR
jgi:hypothetical protein